MKNCWFERSAQAALRCCRQNALATDNFVSLSLLFTFLPEGVVLKVLNKIHDNFCLQFYIPLKGMRTIARKDNHQVGQSSGRTNVRGTFFRADICPSFGYNWKGLDI